MAAHFDDDRDWPRRLLHVPSMTSYPWTPGDRYGKTVKPAYLAISDHLYVGPLALKGRRESEFPGSTYPEHFTAQELQDTLDAMIAEANTKSDQPYEHVWIDIACIDQNPNSRDTASEIGRQAKIFSRAAYVYVWLCKTDHGMLMKLELADYSDQEQALDAMVDRAGRRCMDLEDLLSLEFVKYLTADPWFSSLWTLQEAFLRPDALIMTRNARESLWYEKDAGKAMTTLRTVLDAVWSTWLLTGDFRFRDDTVFGPGWNNEDLKKLRRTIEESGLVELFERCPTGLLTMARHRQTGPDNTTDRIYGIMQVFDLRVGKSRPGADPDHFFTLHELEDELGAALMAKDPVLSQLHIYQSPTALGKGWRVNEHSRPADWFQDVVRDFGYDGPASSRLSRKDISMSQMSPIKLNGTLWCHIKGPAVPLRIIQGTWEDIVAKVGFGLHMVLLGVDCPKPTRSHDMDGRVVEYMLKEISELVDQHPQASVVLLGVCRTWTSRDGTNGDPTEDYRLKRAFGLVVIPCEPVDAANTSVWRRIAICSWDLEHKWIPADLKPFLMGQDASWSHLEGILA